MSKKLITAFITCLLVIISFFYCNSPEKPTIPALVYHSVSEDMFSKNTSLFVRPEEFEKQIKWIADNNYTTIFANESFTSKKYKKPLIITFDDGYEDNYTNVFPLIKKYNIKITIFVVTDAIGARRKLNSNQIIEMHDSGLVSFQSHTRSHPNLLKIGPQQLDTELKGSKDRLFFITNEFPTAIAYPYGSINPETVKAVKKYYSRGYVASNRALPYTDDDYMIKRFGVGRYSSLRDIKKYLKNL
jgi:peptidoglycan/xylan/chitin deacetylase (PgdA/CDA1 family)